MSVSLNARPARFFCGLRLPMAGSLGEILDILGLFFHSTCAKLKQVGLIRTAMNTRSVIGRWLDPQDYAVLGQAVANGYAACDKIMRSTPALSQFAPGIEHRSYLNPIFVQYSLMVAAGMQPHWTFAIRPNDARNCVHLRLFIKATCAITAHFMGRTEPRAAARAAVNRAVLASVNGDLFDDCGLPEESTHLYCHLLHAGNDKPTMAVLAIPVENQQNYYGDSVSLVLPPPLSAPVEQIADELFFKLRKLGNDDAEEVA